MEEQDLSQKIDAAQKSVQQIGKNVSIIASDVAKTFEPVFVATDRLSKEINAKLGPIIDRIAKSYQLWLEKNKPTIELIGKKIATFIRQAHEWQETQKISVTFMAENGWFPNWKTFYFQPSDNNYELNTLMMEHLNQSWDEITGLILKKCPNRSHILKAAFELHKTGNFVASIPLFLSQADGIFCEEIKSFLFAGDKPNISLERMVESGEIQKGFFEDIFLLPYKIKTQFAEGMSKASKTAKLKAPNRHGIMHGYRKHLDYGTELNSAKCFSLLAFVVFSVKDVFKGNNYFEC